MKMVKVVGKPLHRAHRVSRSFYACHSPIHDDCSSLHDSFSDVPEFPYSDIESENGNTVSDEDGCW
jgi:hypothetical protein